MKVGRYFNYKYWYWYMFGSVWVSTSSIDAPEPAATTTTTTTFGVSHSMLASFHMLFLCTSSYGLLGAHWRTNLTTHLRFFNLASRSIQSHFESNGMQQTVNFDH